MSVRPFLITSEDREKYHEKEIDFVNVPIQEGRDAGLRRTGRGKLRISAGPEGSAQIYVERWLGCDGETQSIYLAEAPFRSIVPLANGFLLDWSEKE
ncbi:MAG TPA: hypothetical protein VN939_18250 [Chthoniobacterales bacterium]|jgi:hypothetical protein|nr:hypothetical protein [Chthoniobacterales bacterium]